MRKILSFGELLQRNTVPFLLNREHVVPNCPTYQKCYGGTECNVLVGLTNFDDIQTTYVSGFANNQDGKDAMCFLASLGMKTMNLAENKKGEMAKYYFLPLQKDRTKATLYDRANSIVTYLQIKDLIDGKVFENDASIFHTSGVALALAWKGSNTCLEFIKEAKKHGKSISFDFNYRPNLWIDETPESGYEKAKLLYKELMQYIDIAMLSDLDLKIFLGFEGTTKEMAVACQNKYHLKYLVVRNRVPVNDHTHKVNALIINNRNEICQQSDDIYFHVDERIGGGDAFAAGVLYGILNKLPLQMILTSGLECFYLKHRIMNDCFISRDRKIKEHIEHTMIKQTKILLSVSDLDESFCFLKDELSKVANVDVKDLSFKSLEGYDIFIGKKLSKSQLQTADQLKAIFTYKTGVDNFPLKELQEKGIELYNSHANSKIIAEYAFALAMSLTNRVTEFDKKMRQGIWYDNEAFYWKNLFSMKIGLVGYGSIGQAIHEILINNKIETYTLNRGKQYHHIHVVETLEELCENTDLIIISLPKTQETNDLFNRELFAHLKGKYIVNVGRSNCINEVDLYEALVHKQLAGAALDAWDTKPSSRQTQYLPFKMPLNELDNVILSPHQAMRIQNGTKNYVADILAQVQDFIDGKKLENKVDLNKGY